MIDDMFYGASPIVFEKAKELRRRTTEAERQLWKYLSNKNLSGHKFRRQHPISEFIVDFYCHSIKLAIELDGEYHQEAEQLKYDLAREEELKLLGITIIRFTNSEVLNKIHYVIKKITEQITPKT